MPSFLDKRRSESSLRSRVLLMLFPCGGAALAQDPFEIHIYEYEPMTWGQYSLEARLNFDPKEQAPPWERFCRCATRRT